MLKAMAKKVKSIVTLSFSKWWKRLYVCHVGLHLSEDSLRFDTSSSAVSETFFGCQQFPGFSFVSVEPVVDLDCPSVTTGFVAEAA